MFKLWLKKINNQTQNCKLFFNIYLSVLEEYLRWFAKLYPVPFKPVI